MFLLIGANSCTYVYYPNYPVIAEVKENSLGGQVTLGFSKAQISGWYAIDSNIFFTGTVSGALSWLEENSLDNISFEGNGDPTKLCGLLARGLNLAINWADKNMDFQK